MIEALRPLLPGSVHLVSGLAGDLQEALFPEEEALVARAAPKRRLEFTAGRTAARRALAALGVAPCAIPAGNRREPLHPPGVALSITHSEGRCAAAAAPAREIAGIGIDLELRRELAESVLARVLTPVEIGLLAGLDPDSKRKRGVVLFSAKEALFKCLYPLARRWFGFLDAELRIDEASATVEILSLDADVALALEGRRVLGRFAQSPEGAAAAVWVGGERPAARAGR